MSHLFRKRLEDELKIAMSKNTPKRTVAPKRKGDPSVWRGYIEAPDGVMHSFEIRVGDRFPLEPPEVEWLTPISHPNIEPPRPEGMGRVCLPWITDRSEWSPQTRINSIVDGLVYLLNNPNPADPLMHTQCLRNATEMIKKELKQADKTVDVPKVQTLLTTAITNIERGDNRLGYDLVKQAALLAGLGKRGK